MAIQDFEAEPLKKPHPAYEAAFLALKPAPEVATGEIMVASMVRNVGFVDAGASLESRVPGLGRDFDSGLRNAIKKAQPPTAGQLMKASELRRVVTDLVASPRQPREKKRQASISPLVPDAALYSLSARLVGNPWNPGNLVRSVIGFGSVSSADAAKAWDRLFEGLSVQPNDDILARILEHEFTSWRPKDVEWKHRPLQALEAPLELDLAGNSPARQFCRDLDLVIALKPKLTRRQWVSTIGSLVRLGAASHVLWLCKANATLWRLMQEAMEPGRQVATVTEVSARLKEAPHFFNYGERTAMPIKAAIRDYITARFGINLVLFLLDEAAGEDQVGGEDANLATAAGIHGTLRLVAKHRDAIGAQPLGPRLGALLERNPKTLQCKHGVTSNLDEFLTYSLSRRPTLDPKDLNYDQGYWVRKAAAYSSAPWILLAGPIALLTMAHCCTTSSKAPKTILDLAAHVQRYGIALTVGGRLDDRLVESLRNLGLVLDSPDAEGGMIVRSPFPR